MHFWFQNPFGTFSKTIRWLFRVLWKYCASHLNETRKGLSERKLLHMRIITRPLTCFRFPGGQGCTGAAPCPGAPGGPAAWAARRENPGPGPGWGDAGGTDLHLWVDPTQKTAHWATGSTKPIHGSTTQGTRRQRQQHKNGNARQKQASDQHQSFYPGYKRHYRHFSVDGFCLILGSYTTFQV